MILPFFEKEPDWSQVHQYTFLDGREVFEISLENAMKYFPASMMDSFPNQNPADLMIQNIMFVSHPTEERFDPVIARYYPDDVGSIKEFEGIYYDGIPHDWSGKVDIWTYDERHFVGFTFEEGEVVNQFYNRPIDSGSEGFRMTDCREYTMSYFVPDPEGFGGTVVSVRVVHCSGSGGHYTPDGGSGEGGDYHHYQRGTDGAGGACSSCYDPPEVPEPNLTIKIDLSIKLNPRVNCITNKMSLNSFVKEIAKFTETEQDPANTTLKLGSLSGDNGQMEHDGKGNYEITINSNNLNRPDLLIARTILHELVHAEIQEALRKKGVTAWDNDFGRNFDTYVKLYKGNNDQHHSYMAEQLLGKMGAALMDIHKNQFPEDFAKLTTYMKSTGDYPKGIPVDFYMNLCWQGLEGTLSFRIMKKITTNPPILSPYEKYERDVLDAEKLTKPCGN